MTQKISFTTTMTDMTTNLHRARRIIDKAGQEFSYDLAISILHELYKDGYCIHQSYTREDIEANLGHKPTEDEFENLHESLGCFANIEW